MARLLGDDKKRKRNSGGLTGEYDPLAKTYARPVSTWRPKSDVPLLSDAELDARERGTAAINAIRARAAEAARTGQPLVLDKAFSTNNALLRTPALEGAQAVGIASAPPDSSTEYTNRLRAWNSRLQGRQLERDALARIKARSDYNANATLGNRIWNAVGDIVPTLADMETAARGSVMQDVQYDPQQGVYRDRSRPWLDRKVNEGVTMASDAAPLYSFFTDIAAQPNSGEAWAKDLEKARGAKREVGIMSGGPNGFSEDVAQFVEPGGNDPLNLPKWMRTFEEMRLTEPLTEPVWNGGETAIKGAWRGVQSASRGLRNASDDVMRFLTNSSDDFVRGREQKLLELLARRNGQGAAQTANAAKHVASSGEQVADAIATQVAKQDVQGGLREALKRAAANGGKTGAEFDAHHALAENLRENLRGEGENAVAEPRASTTRPRVASTEQPKEKPRPKRKRKKRAAPVPQEQSVFPLPAPQAGAPIDTTVFTPPSAAIDTTQWR